MREDTVQQLRNQKRWGPHVWHFLHTLAATYTPEKQRDAVRALLDNLPDLLPCGKCASHLRETYERRPFDKESRERALGSREGLVAWVNSLHNRVSSFTGGEQYPVFATTVPTQCNKWLQVAVAVLLVLLVVCAMK